MYEHSKNWKTTLDENQTMYHECHTGKSFKSIKQFFVLLVMYYQLYITEADKMWPGYAPIQELFSQKGEKWAW